MVVDAGGGLELGFEIIDHRVEGGDICMEERIDRGGRLGQSALEIIGVHKNRIYTRGWMWYSLMWGEGLRETS